MNDHEFSLQESYISDNESGWSFNNNCSSETSDTLWGVANRNWSAKKSVKKTLPSAKTKPPLKPAPMRTKAKRPDQKKVKTSPSSTKKKKWKKPNVHAAGVVNFVRRIVKSDPSEHRMLKAVLGFPVGLAIAGCVFLVVIQPLDLDPDVRNLAGSGMGVVLALGFAFSVQVSTLCYSQ